MTLDALGKEVGVSGVALGRYEEGRMPRDKVMQEIIRVTMGEVTANDWFDIPAAAQKAAVADV